MSQMHCTQPTIYKFFCFKIEIKTKADLYMPCEAMAHSTKYHNPLLYPKMFPWLFPYGLGGIGSVTHKGKISSLMHKGHLLMYHDKRFQKDQHFPLITFNHEQIKEGTTGGYLLTEKRSFPIIADRLLNLDSEVL